MRTRCPSCGATLSLDALIAHDAAREALAAAFKLSGQLGSALVRYLALFRPESRELTMDRVARLVGDLLPDLQAQQISRNGQDWISLGRLVGNTDGIDIDAAGFGPSDYFWYVRVTDDPNSGGSSGSSAGADIDAIGALSTRTACELTDATPLQGLGAGDVITINGYGFSNGATVRFGNVPAAATTVVSSQVIRATVPGGVVGSFVVAVDLPDGTTCTLDSPAVNTESESWGYLKAMYR